MKPIFKTYGIVLLLFMGCTFSNYAQTPRLLNPMMQNLWNEYSQYEEKTITSKYLKYEQLQKIIEKHSASGQFKNQIIGQSVLGKNLHHLTIGKGKTKLFFWSQMHGDESTATMALMDVFNFLSSTNSNKLRDQILQTLELHFIPMVNPDGSDVWKRRNALGIDLNRDAIALVSPEAKALKNTVLQVAPMFGFNLHDQGSLYSVERTKQPASISFLAPAYDQEKSINPIRKKAMQLIVDLNQTLQEILPGKIAKYDDEHEPRAFGDNFQKWGVSTVLIESGGYKDDFQKQYLRKINFITLLQAMLSCCEESYSNNKLSEYDKIPQNTYFTYDLLVKNIKLNLNEQTFSTNIGINTQQLPINGGPDFYFKGSIAEIGDTSGNWGYTEVDGENCTLVTPKTTSRTLEQLEKLTFKEELELLRNGYMYAVIEDAKYGHPYVKNHLLNWCKEEFSTSDNPKVNDAANFFLAKDGKIKYAVINGFWLVLEEANPKIHNALYYK